MITDWPDATPCAERTVRLDAAAPYVPGRFFERELPPLLAVLAVTPGPLAAVIVDGHVWLDGGRLGLGAHLHAALGGGTPVIGVAKTRYRGAPAIEVRRGGSANPLHVSAIGVDPAEAAAGVARMHGPHRRPTMILRADHLCRGRA